MLIWLKIYSCNFSGNYNLTNSIVLSRNKQLQIRKKRSVKTEDTHPRQIYLSQLLRVEMYT